MLVRHGTHDAAHGEAVEIVVNEDQHAQQDGGQLRAHAGFDVGLGPAAKGGAAARLVHQGHHHAQQHQENQDAQVVGVGHGGDEAAAEQPVHGVFQMEVIQQQRPGGDAHEQGGVYFLGNQGQHDGDDGRHQRPEAVQKRADRFHRFGHFLSPLREAGEHGQRRHGEQTDKDQ